MDNTPIPLIVRRAFRHAGTLYEPAALGAPDAVVSLPSDFAREMAASNRAELVLPPAGPSSIPENLNQPHVRVRVVRPFLLFGEIQPKDATVTLPPGVAREMLNAGRVEIAPAEQPEADAADAEATPAPRSHHKKHAHQ